MALESMKVSATRMETHLVKVAGFVQNQSTRFIKDALWSVASKVMSVKGSVRK